MPAPRFPSIPEALTHWATATPDAEAYSFPGPAPRTAAGGGRPPAPASRDVTFAGLDRAAAAVSAGLSHLPPGERVLLLFPPGLDYLAAFLGCLRTGVVAVPLYPPRPGSRTDRVAGVVRDCRPAAALTSPEMYDPVAKGLEPAGVQVRAVRAELDGPAPQAPQGSGPSGDDLAFLQYTSGSTGTPKGVMITHGNLVANEEDIAAGFGVRDDDVVLSWLPMYHDMGLIGTALLPLYRGIRSVLVDTFAFVQDPLAWPLAVDAFGATCSGGPNFAYQLLADRYDPNRLAGLDLSHWRIAFNGAEPVLESTMEAFAGRYAAHGFDPHAFLPCYGLAEATLFVTGARPGAGRTSRSVARSALEQGSLTPAAPGGPGSTATVVAAGVPVPGTRVVIRDEAGSPVPDGGIGEICVAGPGVARGYWGAPETTAETFGARITGHDGHFLRTGDVGGWFDGELFPISRTKDLIIVAGRNFYPHDIERAGAAADPVLRAGGAAAFQPGPAAPDVVLVAEVSRDGIAALADPGAAAAVREAVARAVGLECDLRLAEVVLVQPGSVPKTSSGKIRRRETRERYLAGGLRVLVPADGGPGAGRPATAGPAAAGAGDPGGDPAAGARALLAELVRRSAGARVTDADFARPLAELGLDSLRTTALKIECERRVGRPLDPALFLGDRSLDEVAAALVAAAGSGTRSPAGVAAGTDSGTGDTGRDVAGSAPAADGQTQMQFHDALQPGDTANHLATALRLSRPYASDELRGALAATVARHPALRTVLGPLGGETQTVRPHASLDWSELRSSADTGAEVEAFLRAVADRPFDLTDGPLVRGAAVLTPTATVLLVVCHHAVADYWSLRIVLRDLLAALPGIDVAPVSSPGPEALDILQWARERHAAVRTPTAQRRLGELAQRWRPQRDHVLFPDPAGQAAAAAAEPDHAATVDFAVGGAAALRERARRRGLTPFVTVTAAYVRALHRASGLDQVIVGTPFHGRADWRSADLVGYLVSMVPLAGDLRGADDLATLEDRMGHDLRAALEYADVPFAQLVRALRPERQGQNPLFQATVTYQQSPDGVLEDAFSIPSSGCRQVLGEVELAAVDVPPRHSPFAVSLYGARHGDRLVFRLVHQTRRVSPGTAGGIARDVADTLQAAAAGTDVPTLLEEAR